MATIVGVAQEDLSRAGAREQRVRDVETVRTDLRRVTPCRQGLPGDRPEANRGDARRPRPGSHPLLVEGRTSDGGARLAEGDRAVARLAWIAWAATHSVLICGRRRRRTALGNTRSRPGEAAVRRAAHPDAVGAVRPVEVDVGVVDDSLPVVDDRGIATAVEVVTTGQRRERDDPVVPVLAVVGRGVDP